MHVSDLWSLLKQTFTEWSEDKVPRMSAALAYYTTFSIAPILLIAIAIAGFIFGRDAAQNRIAGQLTEMLGPRAAQAIEGMLASSQQHKTQGIITTILGVVVLIFGAMGVFGELQDSLNTIWEVQPKPNRGWRGLVQDRLLSFSMVAGIAFLLLVSLVVSVALAGIQHLVGNQTGVLAVVWQVINLVISLVVVTALFAMMYKVLPDVNLAWRDVILGAVVTAVLFTVGKYLIGLYLGKASVGSSFGAAGSLAVLLIWVYYSAQITFLGAELTHVYTKQFGSRAELAKNAIPLTREARANQGIPHKEDLEAAAKTGVAVEEAPQMQEAFPPASREKSRSGGLSKWVALVIGIGAFAIGRITKRQRRIVAANKTIHRPPLFAKAAHRA